MREDIRHQSWLFTQSLTGWLTCDIISFRALAFHTLASDSNNRHYAHERHNETGDKIEHDTTEETTRERRKRYVGNSPQNNSNNNNNN